MASTHGSPADSNSTRTRITGHLRRGARSVDELAREVGTTSNAVRAHLVSLERDGLVASRGVRRGGGVGKPATLYALTPAAELEFSRAYPTVLTAVMAVLVDKLDTAHAEQTLRKVGARLATSLGGEAGGDLRARVDAAAAALVKRGGDAEVVEDDGAYLIHGFGCPLSESVSSQPKTCRAVRALVSGVTGAHTEERCEHGERPQCRFRVSEPHG